MIECVLPFASKVRPFGVKVERSGPCLALRIWLTSGWPLSVAHDHRRAPIEPDRLIVPDPEPPARANLSGEAERVPERLAPRDEVQFHRSPRAKAMPPCAEPSRELPPVRSEPKILPPRRELSRDWEGVLTLIGVPWPANALPPLSELSRDWEGVLFGLLFPHAHI